MDNVFNFLKRIPEMLEESKIIILMVDGLGSIDLRIPRAKKRVYQTVSLRVLPHSFIPSTLCFVQKNMDFSSGI